MTRLRCSRHRWNGCRCLFCGAVRETYHLWRGLETVGKCSLCRRTRDEIKPTKCLIHHLDDGCYCKRCGLVRDEGHGWTCEGRCFRCDRQWTEAIPDEWHHQKSYNNAAYSNGSRRYVSEFTCKRCRAVNEPARAAHLASVKAADDARRAKETRQRDCAHSWINKTSCERVCSRCAASETSHEYVDSPTGQQQWNDWYNEWQDVHTHRCRKCGYSF